MRQNFYINADQLQEIREARKSIMDKRVDKRLWALQLRGEGMANQEIAEKLDTSAKVVSRWVSAYRKGGIAALMNATYGRIQPNMSFEREAQILAKYESRTKNGLPANVGEIKNVYEALSGHKISSGQIYRVLRRHGWCKSQPQQ